MVFRNKNVKQRSIIKNKVLQEGRTIMKKKIIIAAGILAISDNRIIILLIINLLLLFVGMLMEANFSK